MALSDSQTGRRPFWRRSEPRPPPIPSLPQLPRPPSLHAVLTTPVDQTGACWFLPCPRGLPRYAGGSASTTSLSRPAPASHALRPTRLLTHHSWALSRGSALTSFPARTLASYQALPTTA